MASTETTLAELALANQVGELETQWLEAIEDSEAYRGDMLAALEALVKNKKAEQAATLGWAWIEADRERLEPADQLEIGREVLLRVGDNEELRQEVIRLYREVYAEHPGIERLIEVSGISGGKTVRRALRTLGICATIQPGDFLISRSDEHAAKVTEVDAKACLYTVCPVDDTRILDADELALAYDPTDANDFRVLQQLEPARMDEMLTSDPADIIIGVLRGHQDRIDSDELEHLLSPRYIPAAKWKGWWTKAKAALKRCPNVVLEGKTRVILTYHEQAKTLEDEIGPQWKTASLSHERLAVVETYLRESKARHHQPAKRMVKRICTDLTSRIGLVRQSSPPEALTEALVMDRLNEEVELPEGFEAPVDAILTESSDVPMLMRRISEPTLFRRAIPHIIKVRTEDWLDIFADLLPYAPQEACETMAKEMEKAGGHDRLVDAVRRAAEDFTHSIDVICWLWRGSAVKGIEPMPPRQMLLRMLEHLAELSRSDSVSAQLLRDTRLKTRNALSAGKYGKYTKVIEEMDAGLASTVRRSINRLDGLGQVVHSKLIRIIMDTHPELIKPIEQVDPWIDEETIWTTSAGFAKHQEEIDVIERVKIPENAKAIGEAASHGDLSENSEYKFALEERDLLQGRLRRMREELALARVLTPDTIRTDVVSIGTRVRLRAVDDGQEVDVSVLGPWDADIDQRIYNYRAPLCQNLKGLAVGDEANLDLGSGEKTYRVVQIDSILGS